MANIDAINSVISFKDITSEVRRSFARLYAALKARELQTLRQLDVIKCRFEETNLTIDSFAENVKVCYDNETTILSEISKYGIINFEKVNLDSKIFSTEDYIVPVDDFMFSYKCIDDISKSIDSDRESLQALIEENALKQITNVEDCICHVNIPKADISKKFYYSQYETQSNNSPSSDNISDYNRSMLEDVDDKIEPDLVVREMIEGGIAISNANTPSNTSPTKDWLDSIKCQTETEPSQTIDVMEHSKIEYAYS